MRTKLQDFNVLMHWPRVLFIYCFIIIGTFMAYPNINWQYFTLEIMAIFFAVQLGAYRLDELVGGHCSTRFTSYELAHTAVWGLIIAAGIGTYLIILTGHYEMIIYMIFTGFLLLAYNFELFNGKFHNIFWFMLVWAFSPIVFSYYLQTRSFSFTVIILGILGMVIGWKHIWSYGLTRCHHKDTCRDYALDGNFPLAHKYPFICHGMQCNIRVFGTKKLQTKLAWVLIDLDVLQMVILTCVIVLIQVV